MKLLELNLIEFGAIKDRRIVPGEGLTVIEGENESGKSTIQLFIKFMLYGLPKRGHPDRERSVSRDGHRAAGTMTVRAEGVTYRIERSFVETGRGSEKLSVYRLPEGEKVFVGEVPGEALLKAPKEVYESSCSIGQMQCAAPGGKKEAAAIRNLLSSADESVDPGRIEKKLEELRVLYRHKRGEGGRLYDLSVAIRGEQTRLNEATENHLRIAELREKLKKNKRLTEENETKLEQARTLQNEMNRIEVLRRFDALRQSEAELERIATQREALKNRELETSILPVSTDVARLRVLADQSERAEQGCAEAKAEKDRLTEGLSENEELLRTGERIENEGGLAVPLGKLKRCGLWEKLGIAVGVLGLPVLFGGVVYACLKEGNGGMIIGAFGAFLAVASLLLFSLGRKRGKELARTYGVSLKELPEHLRLCADTLKKCRAAASELARADEALRRAEKQVDDLLRELTAAMRRTLRMPTVSPENARAEADRLDRFLKEYHELVKQEAGLTDSIRRDREILSLHDERELRSGLTVEPGEISREMMAEAETNLRFLVEKQRKLRQAEKDLHTELINRTASTEDPIVVADRLAALRSEYAEGEEYYEAVVTALDALSAAGEAMRGNFTPTISRNAGKMMEYISDGRYAELQAGNTLSVSLTEAAGQSTTGDMLSGGTRDAAYITLRIALMMQIYGGELPPLMMDESLCQMDDERMKRFLRLLAELSEERLQCLLFTCHKREAEACRTLNLPFTLIRLSEK